MKVYEIILYMDNVICILEYSSSQLLICSLFAAIGMHFVSVFPVCSVPVQWIDDRLSPLLCSSVSVCPIVQWCGIDPIHHGELYEINIIHHQLMCGTIFGVFVFSCSNIFHLLVSIPW